MMDRKAPIERTRPLRSPRGAHKDAAMRIILAPAEAEVLREILSKNLHIIEAEVAGNDWQDLSEAVLAKEALLRRLVGDLSV
jgi:hypothetical protein